MADPLEQARYLARLVWVVPTAGQWEIAKRLLLDMADEIERAKADNARLREALERFAKIDMTGPFGDSIGWDILNARAALKGGKNDA